MPVYADAHDAPMMFCPLAFRRGTQAIITINKRAQWEHQSDRRASLRLIAPASICDRHYLSTNQGADNQNSCTEQDVACPLFSKRKLCDEKWSFTPLFSLTDIIVMRKSPRQLAQELSAVSSTASLENIISAPHENAVSVETEHLYGHVTTFCTHWS